ncbi:MAG: amino acid permease [Oligoflexia bacterium]|nr:amino acid permease [Oligoflexia bacterium]
MSEQKKLKRAFGSIQVQLISLGGIIGSSYFLGLGELISRLGPSVVVAFALGGIIVWYVAVAMGELCVAMPREGSLVSFSKELIGAPFAAGIGWSYWFNWVAYIASEMIGGGIILHKFLPQIPAMGWTAVLGIAVSILNLMEVKWFGLIDSVLSFIKVLAICLFALLGVFIWLGFAGNQGYVGTKILITQNESLTAALFPAGFVAVILSMVIVLVNCAGTELIALSSAETDDPKKHVVRDSKRVALSTVALFVIPLSVLMLIFPWSQSNLENSVFSVALESYGFRWAAVAFSFVTLTAAISCANSGLYGTVRALYGLGKEGLGPKILTKLNHAAVPSVATWVTIFGCWAFFPLYLFFEGTKFYIWLLSVAGFSGAVCWLSISLSHFNYCRKTFGKAPRWAYFSIAFQVFVLSIIPFSDDFRDCLIIGIPALVVPMLIVYYKNNYRRRHKLKAIAQY